MARLEVRRNDFHDIAAALRPVLQQAVEETSMDLAQAMADAAPFGLGSSVTGRVSADRLHAKAGIQGNAYRRVWWVTFVHWGTRYQPSQPFVVRAAERQRAWFIDRIRRAWKTAARG